MGLTLNIYFVKTMFKTFEMSYFSRSNHTEKSNFDISTLNL